jgi:hypothetical protein
MSDNLNPEVNQPTDELSDEQLGEVAGAGGPQVPVAPPQEGIIAILIGLNQPAAPQVPGDGSVKPNGLLPAVQK